MIQEDIRNSLLSGIYTGLVWCIFFLLFLWFIHVARIRILT